MLAFLYTASTFLVMVILVIGITMINNYDRMVNMEDAIYQLSENLEEDTSLEAAAEEENRQALETAQASDGQGGADTEETSADASEETPPEEASAETPAPEETATAEENRSGRCPAGGRICGNSESDRGDPGRGTDGTAGTGRGSAGGHVPGCAGT